MKTAAILAAALAGTWLLGSQATTAEPAGPAKADKVDPAAVEFFEKKVRPVLVENCYKCHGDKKQMGGLRLDNRDGMAKGSDNGPVIVPGQPDKSPMISAIRHLGEIKMPPKTKMGDDAIDSLVMWVKMGAPWPDSGTATKTSNIAEVRKTHWSFQPVKNQTPPAVKNQGWVKTPVDAFVLARLEAKGMTPAPQADPRTLVRRAYFDLLGLPPSPEEVDAFVQSATRNPQSAMEELVDRLLASPHYGERWARHWLDVARYADTKGYVFLEERKFPAAYTYRDYVIRAFNDDLPYDRFILEQLAADRLPAQQDQRYLAAMGYLTLGRRFLNNVHDIIDDRIDVVSRGLQGLTVSCARCHDHKFDPIPTKDYYSLYGIFAASVEPKDLPLVAEPERTEAYAAFEKELKAREQKVQDFLQQKHRELLGRLRGQVGDYLVAVRDAERLPGEDHYEALNAGDLNPEIVRRWQAYLAETKKQHHPIWAAWHAFSAIPQKEFKDKAGPLAEKLAANSDEKAKLNPKVAEMLKGKTPATLQELARWYGELFSATDKAWEEAKAKDANLKALPDREHEALRQVLYAGNAPVSIPIADIEGKRVFDRAAREQLTKLRKDVDTWKAGSPAAPPRAMVLNDVPNPGPTRVLVRGNPGNLGDAVPRQYLEIIAGEERKPFTEGSGRLDLARAIASKDNPLTARVMVNRIWLDHFGQGLVRTPSDFGLRGEPPTHPELLDYLARSFMDNSWSVKKMHRLIMLSSTYQQASIDNLKYATADPDNRLLWKMNRHRLDFEQLRDSLLAASGRLDRKQFGPAADITTQPFTQRRTIYGFIERQNLPGIFRTFDFASPDAHTPQRYTTTVPQQALFLMNSPFVVEQARHLAARKDVASLEAADQRVALLYRLCYGRKPAPEETSLGLRFIQEAEKEPGGKLAAWEKYCQVLLLSNEFAFVD